MRFSSSKLSKFMSCALQGGFKYVDRIPEPQGSAATFGTCVHDALEHYSDPASETVGDVEAAVARFRHTWEYPEVLDVAIDYWNRNTLYGSFKEIGVKAIRDYHEHVSWQDRTVLAVEHEFSVPFGRHWLGGKVDLIEEVDSRLVITDWKTGGWQPTADELRLNIQGTCYSYSAKQPEFWLGSKDQDPESEYYQAPMPNGEELWERFQHQTHDLIWFHLRKTKALSMGYRDDLDYMRAYRCCEQVERAIELRVFVPNLSGRSCTTCSYTKECPAYVPDPNEEEAEKWS